LSIASNIQWYALIPHKAYSFIMTLFLGPFDDVITKFYCILLHVHPLLGNVLVNKFLRSQIRGKQSVARLCNNR
jgi:hypothetical protein